MVKGVDDLQCESQGFGKRDRSSQKAMGERLAFKVFHDQEWLTVVLTDVIHRADVRVTQRRNRSCLPFETRTPTRMTGQMGRKDLQSDDSLETCIAGAIDPPHATGPERAEDHIRTDTLVR
jgi:hypothetical protein